MIDTWTLLNLALAFLCGAYVALELVQWLACHLADRDDLNSG